MAANKTSTKMPTKGKTKKTTPKKASVKKAPKNQAPKSKASKAGAAKAGAANASSDKLFGIAPYVAKKGEEYMSDAQLAHFRSILKAWKAQLMSDVDSTLNFMQDESASLPDVNDRATQEEEFAVALRTRDRERKLIRKIDKSINEIDQGEYGFCETCGIEIGLLRLEARPTATQCIDCKTLSEIKEQQTHGGM